MTIRDLRRRAVQATDPVVNEFINRELKPAWGELTKTISTIETNISNVLPDPDNEGNVLTVVSGEWGSATQRVPLPTADGQILIADGGEWTTLDLGTPGQILVVNDAGTGVEWVSGTSGSPYIPALYSPLALWQFDQSGSSTTDRSGNGFTLTGTPSYSPILPGFPAIRGGGVTCTGAGLQITGDVTVSAVLQYNTVNEFWVGWGANGETEATNALYLMRLHITDAWDITAGWEHGAGVDDFTLIADALPFIHNLVLVTMTRISNVCRIYVNNVKVATSGTLTTPTGGTSGALRFGSNGSGAATSDLLLASEGVWNTGLSDAQVAALYDNSLGLIYGGA